MASIDKIYGTWEQYIEFGEWCLEHQRPAMVYFTEWSAEWIQDGKTHPITLFPEEIDMWMLRNCPITWVTDRIKEQYDLGV